MSTSSSKNPEVSNDPVLDKSKPTTPMEESDPTFDLGTQQGGSFSNLDMADASSQLNFGTDTPTPFDNSVGGNSSDGLALPKSVAPSTDLKKEEETTAEAAGITLALPKKNDKKSKSNTTATATKGDSINKKDSGKVGANSKTGQPQADASKMSDVLFSAGVDIREEEALLNSSVSASKSQVQASINIPEHPPFLHPDQVAFFMKKVSKDQNFTQNFSKTPEILSMMSTACETYMKDLITNTIVISRHRRKAVKVNSGRRSNVSIVLKDIAVAQKKDEERRVKKRIALGLEKEDTENKIDSEETLHRASNATAGLRAGSKKQYGWLTSSISKPVSTNAKSAGKVATTIAARGDTGLRFKEAREEPGIVMRDLLFALENRRIGNHNVISKGYARIRD